MESTKKRPIPGTRKIDSTKNGPVPTAANMGPSRVTIGMRAFLKACFRMTGISPSPLARAVSVKSDRMTSSMLARGEGAIGPNGGKDRVIVGNTQFRQESQPPVGKSGTTNEKRTIRNTARTKFGTATPKVANVT